MLLGELPIKNENENIYKLQSTKKQLSQKQLSAIDAWGVSYKFKVDGKSYLLTHGSPDDVLKGYIYPDSDLSIFNLFNEVVFILGHTHYPFIKKFNDKMIINVGSIGLPRDVGNLSSFVIVDTKEVHASIFRTKFETKEILLNGVKNNIHSSVIKLINRRKDDYIGTLI